jgi:hypothetical protein
MTLVEFLLARIDEDEEAALVCYGPEFLDWDYVLSEIKQGTGYIDQQECTYRHALRWDPARVLAECETKRRIVLGDHPDNEYWAYDSILRVLALPYANHPDYDEAWRF